jgi:hypothetical protein
MGADGRSQVELIDKPLLTAELAGVTVRPTCLQPPQ